MHNFSDPRALPLPSVVPMSAGTGSSPRRSPRVHEVQLIGSERHRLILAERVFGWAPALHEFGGAGAVSGVRRWGASEPAWRGVEGRGERAELEELDESRRHRSAGSL